MDVNGLRSFGLSFAGGGLQPWRVPLEGGEPTEAVEAAPGHRIAGVRLASRASGLALKEAATRVADVALQPALAVDAFGNHVQWDGTGLTSVSHLAERHGLAPQPFDLPAEARPVADLTVGDDDVLYLAANGALWMVDLRGRFELTRLEAPAGFKPQRVTSAPGGGAWALDVEQGRLARLGGLPLFTRPLYVGTDADARFGAADPNPDPPRWRVLEGRVPASEKAIALATHRHGKLLVLSLGRASGGASVRLVLDDGRLSLPLRLAGPRFPNTLGWLDAERIALATRGVLKSPDGKDRDPGVWTYAMPATLLERLAAASAEGRKTLPEDLRSPLQPQGDFHPLAGWTGGPFVAGRPGERLHYPRQGSGGVAPAKVARVSTAARARYGLVLNAAQRRAADSGARSALGRIDTRDPGTVWHRLHAEAAVPAGCAMIVWLAANDADAPDFAPGNPEQRAHWHPHLIGERSALPPEVREALPPDLPRAAWVKEPTEVPLGEGVLCCPPGEGNAGRAGLFTVLVQRAGTTVRALQGSRLWVAVELFGDGRATPELAVLRAYAGRLSYRDRYLPALYHERVFGEDADRAGPATGADFLDRFLHLFEGLFTDIEGRIAASALLTDAMACPPETLPWLASWIGLSVEPGMPAERARWMVLNAPQLARRHGTLQGLRLALDIATDGAVTRGRIVVVEDFRLRRTLSTILGARLEDATDPLTTGVAQASNSVVGDSLFLGDANTLEPGQLKTFLALFRHIESAGPGMKGTLQADRAAARKALFDDLAHRVTVLVHEELSPDEMGMVQRLADLGAPAHVLTRVVPAAYPFIVSVASLVGADTYLRAAPPKRPVRVGPGPETSALGGVDTLRGEASLDAHGGAFQGVLPPRGAPQRPVARIAVRGLPPTGIAGTAQPFQLDGSASTADEGLSIETFSWSHLPPR
ncbi:MAG TPA: phage tail protein [Ramlibacter sp.]|uniref:phage tail protein n=1 Tax=Ramlibacter sp. TaxID=1917967 RepID=UPI002D7E1BC6|nr:phage tail protein [Ramlibacter sp.]HET8747465.1 phage tail protein [Ramlibacter sp.]